MNADRLRETAERVALTVDTLCRAVDGYIPLPFAGHDLPAEANAVARGVLDLLAERDRLVYQAHVFETAAGVAYAERDRLLKAARWFAENPPGTPVPEEFDGVLDAREGNADG